MKRLTLAALSLSAALLACAPPLAAQESRPAPAAKNLALEFVGDTDRDYQIQVGGGFETSARLLPGRERPAGASPPTMVKIDAGYEGDAVRIDLSVVFDDSQQPDVPGPKYGRKVQAVASYLAREGESVTLEELSRFGVETMTLKVVRERPRPVPPPLAAAPLVVNNLKGVEVVGLHRDASAPANSNIFKLRLHNVTTKAVTGLSLDYDENSRMVARGRGSHPIIAPGDVHEMPLSYTVGGRVTPDGVAHDAERQRTLRVSTVVFDDGTYEGDAATAASFAAGGRGEAAQFARIIPLLRAHLAAPALDASALDKLKADVSSLRIDADPAAVAALLAEFPSLKQGEGARDAGRDAVRNLSIDMQSGFRSAREGVLSEIARLEQEVARAPGAFDLRARLSALAEKLERWGGR